VSVLLTATIPGIPRPQGSLRIITARNGRAFAQNSSTTVQHRNLVVHELAQVWQDREMVRGPVAARLTFKFARPHSHYGTGRNVDVLKPSAPEHHARTPDADKLARLVLDALTIAGVVRDDCQVALVRAEKQWTQGRSETVVELYELEGEQ